MAAAVLAAAAAVMVPRVLDPSAPAAVDVAREVATDVRVVAPGGSDAAVGSVGAPWATLGHALARLGPGDTLLVRGGTYQERLRGVGVRPGRPEARVTVAAWPGERPVLSGLLWLRGADHWTIDGLHVTWHPDNGPGEHMVKLTGGTGWRYTNAEIWGARSYAAILVAGDPSDWRLDHLYVHDTHATNGTNKDHLIYVNTGTGGGVIERNVLVNSPNGRAVKIGPSSPSTHPVGAVTVRYNTMANNRGPTNIQLSYGASANRIYRNLLVGPDPRRPNIRAYNLNGTANTAHDNAGWGGTAVVEPAPGLADGGGNATITTGLDPATWRPTNPAATAYGAHAPGDG